MFSPTLKRKLPEYMDVAWNISIKRLKAWIEDCGEDPGKYDIPQECPYIYNETMYRTLK